MKGFIILPDTLFCYQTAEEFSCAAELDGTDYWMIQVKGSKVDQVFAGCLQCCRYCRARPCKYLEVYDKYTNKDIWVDFTLKTKR